MIVTFISQCEKNALNKTRRVLDAFANRIGDKTWQTVITNDGLYAVKKLLRRTASKNTAVACHLLRGRKRSELIWVVGNKAKFNAQGIVPVSSTQMPMATMQKEDDWHYLPLIKCITGLAALFHDFGKASQHFQEKLKPESKNKFKPDPLRHEWVSVLILNAIVHGASDEEWLDRVIKGEIDGDLKEIKLIEEPLENLPPAAGLIAWLIVSHHRLPISKKDCRGDNESAKTLATLLRRISSEWGYKNDGNQERCLSLLSGLPSKSIRWLEDVKKMAARMKHHLPLLDKIMSDGSWRLILYHCRLSLMLGDYHYSSQDADKAWQSESMLIANTYKKPADRKGQPNQKLDEHLVKVAVSAYDFIKTLPKWETDLPKVEDVKSLKKKSPPKFRWQDIAVEEIKAWKKQNSAVIRDKLFGFFTVNMASTGCGKTYANPKVMRALSHNGESLRYILALGLRTLTLQTGDEYRKRIGLDMSELAVLIGSKAVMDLHRSASELSNDEANGSESTEPLMDEDDFVYFDHFDNEIPEEKLFSVLKSRRDRQFLYAPVLVCTIDHLMAATECIRGGRYILPSLRLMSSDLVIDEIDDFDGKDLIAIGRLIHLAGMLGRKVMISSATIPPDLAQGYFNAYREGWLVFSKLRNMSSSIGCAWIDEFGAQVETLVLNNDTLATYKACHERFIHERIEKLGKQPTRRKAEIISCEHIKNLEDDSDEEKQSIEEEFFKAIQQTVVKQHKRHGVTDTHSGKIVSFGVVRMARIDPCVALTEYLAMAEWPDDIDIRVMAYHSQQVLLLRHEQEAHLDSVLNRTEIPGKVPKTFIDANIRSHIDSSPTKNMIFILVATPVEEVGRDHDFDWAIIEPSSLRSIIQLAGRVLRHREKMPNFPNVSVMQYNLRALNSDGNEAVYCKPGYEFNHPCDRNYRFATHDLAKLLPKEFTENGINAIPRIKRNSVLDSRNNFADLEHYAIGKLLTSYGSFGPEDMQGWLSHCWWLTAMPQTINRFRDQKGQYNEKLYLVPEQGGYKFKRRDDNDVLVEAPCRISIDELQGAVLSKLWLRLDYAQLLEKYKEQGHYDERFAPPYGEISFNRYGQQKNYRYVVELGLSRLIE